VTLTYTQYQAIAANIRPNGQAFIDGKICDAADGQKYQTTNPAKGQVLASLAHCKAVDVDPGSNCSKTRFNAGTWSRAEPEARKELYLKIAALVT
jgi:acyl-CoA reductase-like NAD-dependent aldehyde dehydrogenase